KESQRVRQERRLSLDRAQDAAILAALVGVVSKRDRRDRRARPGIRYEPRDVSRTHHAGGGGWFRRPDEPVQYGRPFLLGLHVGLYRAPEYVLRLHGAWLRSLLHRALHRFCR